MFYLLITWLILLPICISIGLFSLNLLQDKTFTLKSDRFILALWLGIILLAISNLAVALVLPLSPLVGLLIALIWLVIARLLPQTWQELLQFKSYLVPSTIVQGLVLAVATAVFSSQQVIWYDSGLYHLGSIHWLGKYGSVTGVVLIHSRFGFTSSWFAFATPLIPDFLGENIGAVNNGFIFFVFLFWGLISLNKVLDKTGKISDWFAVIFVSLISFIYLADNNNGYSIISFSQDIPVAFLIGIVAWSILIINQNNEQQKSEVIPLILAIGTFSIKLTAIPLLGFVLGFYLWRTKKILTAIFLITILLLPNTLVSLNTSGCPLYPASVLCLNLPWRVATETITAEVNMIGNLGKIDFEDTQVHPLVKIVQQRYKWLTRSRDMLITFIAYIISLVLGIYLFLSSQKRAITLVAILGLLGTTFIMIVSPIFRFGIGYFMIIPALFTANYLEKYKMNLPQPQNYFKLALLLLSFILVIRGGHQLSSRLLLPPQLPPVELVQDQVNNLQYYYPKNFTNQCWHADLPCATLPIKRDIQLRNPVKGIKAGFVWKTRPNE